MSVSTGATLLCLLSTTAGVPQRDRAGRPHLRSESVVVRFADTGDILLEKNAKTIRPIASVTKLMAMKVLLERAAELPQWIRIEEDDKDLLKHSRSRLRVGRSYRPEDLFSAALVASENRAVYALVRAAGFPRAEFVRLMNQEADRLGMKSTEFRDPAGIDPGNVSCARDLLILLEATAGVPRIAEVAQLDRIELRDASERILALGSTNRLARSDRWSVIVGKTGYTVEAGRALAVRVELGGRPVDMVFLGAREMASVFGDAGRVRRWVEERAGKAASLGDRSRPVALRDEERGDPPTKTARATRGG